MSWITSPHGFRAAEFHRRRKAVEPQAPDEFVVPTLEWQFLKLVFAHPTGRIIRRGGYYYLDLNMYTGMLVSATKDIIEKHGPDYVKDVSLFARRHGIIKDTPLITAQLLPADMIHTILREYPPHLVLRFIDIARVNAPGIGGLGRRKKRAVSMYLDDMFLKITEQAEYHIMRYRGKLKQILRLVHPRPKTLEENTLFQFIVSMKYPPTERLKAYVNVVQRKVSKDEAVNLAIKYRMPFEVLRSSVGLKKLSDEQYEAVIRELAGGVAVSYMLRTIARRLGMETALDILRQKIRYMPLQYAYRSILAIADIDPDSASEMEKIVSGSGRLETLRRELGRFNVSKFVLLLDVSGSMAPHTRLLHILALTLGRLAVDIYAFDSAYSGMRFWRIEKNMLNIEAVREAIRPGGGTPLAEAIMKASEIAKSYGASLVVVTDEMENASMMAQRGEIRPPVDTLVVNPAPYTSEHIIKESGRVVGVAGSTIDSIVASMKYVGLRRIAQTEGVARLHDIVLRLLEPV